jgi:hypothetical protein
MSAWKNTDANSNQGKPKMDSLRTTRENAQLYVLTGNTAGNNIIQVSYNDGGQNNVANIGVTAGQYVYFWANGFSDNKGGQAGNGIPGFFASNTTVSSTSGNTITLGTALFNTVNVGFGIEFDKAISYPTAKTTEKTYNADTILVTPTRIANSAVSIGNVNAGWVQIRKKTNSDGSVRYISETLVALASPVASNTASGNTSWGRAFSGL